MSERWREPFQALAIEDSPDDAIFIGGRWYRDQIITATPEQIERFRLGYLCIACQEPQEEAFPEVCSGWWCPFEIRAHQPTVFSYQFGGEVDLRSDDAREQEAMVEENERRRRLKEQGISLPRRN